MRTGTHILDGCFTPVRRLAWLALLAAASPALAQTAPETPASAATTASTPRHFSGVWDYNDLESINAGTGRREQQPQGAAARAAGPAAAARGLGAPRDAGPPVERRVPPTMAYLIQQAEAFVRDLLEVPEALRIDVSPDAVTFTDDLNRQRTFPTDGRERDYQLSASRFEAKALWDGHQLKRELSGGSGFKIFETYFLSDDGDRLYVIVRVKAPQRPGYVAGFNRVYDRVISGTPAAGR